MHASIAEGWKYSRLPPDVGQIMKNCGKRATVNTVRSPEGHRFLA
jgi:hypothetical protein